MSNTRHSDRLIEELGLAGAGERLNVAAVLFTYRCTIRCRHCLFGAAPHRADVVMTPRQCADALALLHATGRVIHIAGGEPMLYWDELAESVRLAHSEGHPPHFIETNCSFASDDDVVARRLEFLAEHGVRGIYASADAYHQEFVPAAFFLRVRRMAGRIFGERNVWAPDGPDEAIVELESITGCEDRFRSYVRRSGLNVVGTAHRELSSCFEQYHPLDPELPNHAWKRSGDDGTCERVFRAETLWEMHIDPYNNILTNCGIILGRLPDTTPARLLAEGPENANRFVQTVCGQGAVGLARLAARDGGFEMPERVAQTCELCYLARAFLRRRHPEIFGPGDIYEG